MARIAFEVPPYFLVSSAADSVGIGLVSTARPFWTAFGWGTTGAAGTAAWVEVVSGACLLLVTFAMVLAPCNDST
jgi:hypothetical protein